VVLGPTLFLRDRPGKTLVLTNPVGADLGEHLQGHT